MAERSMSSVTETRKLGARARRGRQRAADSSKGIRSESPKRAAERVASSRPRGTARGSLTITEPRDSGVGAGEIESQGGSVCLRSLTDARANDGNASGDRESEPWWWEQGKMRVTSSINMILSSSGRSRNLLPDHQLD
ncbi:hypothetical protein FB451DRAFT_1176676 [Mycena latifolia]|nr:hypothetical protein FB451DRAFT_1176676 [Mycena latifolia]